MGKTKKKYEKPLVETKLITVENGFAISTDLEGFSDVSNFVPGVPGSDVVNW